MSKKQHYRSTGTVYIKLDDIREMYNDFLMEKEKHFPSCDIHFTTYGINDIRMIAVEYSSYFQKDFQYAHEFFFSRYTAETHCYTPRLSNFEFNFSQHVKFDTLLQLRIKLFEMQTCGEFQDCVIFYTVSSDLSHAHVCFYTRSLDTLIAFSTLMLSDLSDYLYTEG